MNALVSVEEALAGWPKPRFDGESVVVPTLCLYPSNAVVNVYVDGTSEVTIPTSAAFRPRGQGARPARP